MANASEVISAINAISNEIARQRAIAENAKTSITNALNTVSALPAAYSEAIAQINAWDSGTPNTFEQVQIDALAALTTEFQGLQSSLTTAQSDLSTINFGG